MGERYAAFRRADSTVESGSHGILFRSENPKKAGSKSWERYEKYKSAQTIGEATKLGAQWQDISADFEKKVFKIQGCGHAAMRTAPEGTPDREAASRAKTKPEVAGQSLNLAVPSNSQSSGGANHQVEMSAATITTLRTMMREEMAYAIGDVEGRFTRRVDESLERLHQQITAEGAARAKLEDRVLQLEQRSSTAVVDNPADDVDRSIAVIGGFGEQSIEHAEEILQELLGHVDGFCDIAMTQSQPPLGLARFESSSKAMQFIKSQKMHKGIQERKLWVAENRTREERCQLKVVSKIKKYLIELGGHTLKDVVASYKMFRVVIRANSKLIPVATVEHHEHSK